MGMLLRSLFAFAMLGSSAAAQDFSLEAFDARGYVAELNVVSETWNEEQMTNADVALIAAIGCGAIRRVVADRLLENAALWIDSVGYPDPEIVAAISMQDFVDFEINAFREMGATESTLQLVAQTFWEGAAMPIEPLPSDVLTPQYVLAQTAAFQDVEEPVRAGVSFPMEAPSFDPDLVAASGAESRFCDARLIGNANPSSQASEEQIVLAGAVLDTVAGAATISVDVLVGSSGLDGGVLTVLSGGVGYDLIKRGLGG